MTTFQQISDLSLSLAFDRLSQKNPNPKYVEALNNAVHSLDELKKYY